MADLAAQLALAKRIIDRLPLCPDHRDKVRGRCLECVNVALLEALEAAEERIAELETWLVSETGQHSATYRKVRAAIAQAKEETA